MTAASVENLRRTLIYDFGNVTAEWYIFKPRLAGMFDPDAFRAMIAELKRRIPPADRAYDEKTNFWSVRVEHYDALTELFGNFAEAEQALRGQGCLF